MIRIVAGELGGRRLRTPSGLHTRPTTERVREALFNILGELRPDCVVWDLCAGSGALGMEALSRGAGQAVFVDSDATACRVLRQNLASLGLATRAQVVELSLQRFLHSRAHKSEPVGLLLCDPPYAAGELPKLLAWLSSDGAACLAPDCRVVIETDVRNRGDLGIGTRYGALVCEDVRRYGDTVLLFWTVSALAAYEPSGLKPPA